MGRTLWNLALMGGLVSGICSGAEALTPTEAPKPQIQSHSLHKEVFATATLAPSSGEKITGNVEFLAGPMAKVQVTLANGAPAEVLAVSLLDTQQCPGGEASSGEVGSGKELYRLGNVVIKKGGVGSTQRRLKDVRSREDWPKVVPRAVVVRKTVDGPLIACGILQPTRAAD